MFNAVIQAVVAELLDWGDAHRRLRLVSHFIPPMRLLGPYHFLISWFFDNPDRSWLSGSVGNKDTLKTT